MLKIILFCYSLLSNLCWKDARPKKKTTKTLIEQMKWIIQMNSLFYVCRGFFLAPFFLSCLSLKLNWEVKLWLHRADRMSDMQDGSEQVQTGTMARIYRHHRQITGLIRPEHLPQNKWLMGCSWRGKWLQIR